MRRNTNSPETIDTLVIGGGVIGLTVALELLDRGRSVTVLDAGTAESGCSTMNAGWISLSISVPLPGPGVMREIATGLFLGRRGFSIAPHPNEALLRWILAFALRCNASSFRRGVDALVQLSEGVGHLDGWTRLQNRIGLDVWANGMLIVCKTERSLIREWDVVRLTKGYGLSSPEPVSASDLSLVDSALSDGLAGGIYLPDERHVEPKALMSALRQEVVSAGGDLKQEERVLAFDYTRSQVLEARSDRSSYAPKDVVLSAGVGTRRLAKALGAQLPIEAGRGISLDFRSPDVFLRQPTYLVEERMVLSPYAESMRLAGRMEVAARDEHVDRRIVKKMSQAPLGYLRGWHPASHPTAVAAGLRPLTPDGLPVIGYLKPFQNVVVATGHQMLGVMLAPATASATANLMTKQLGEERLDAFSPSRFLSTPGRARREDSNRRRRWLNR